MSDPYLQLAPLKSVLMEAAPFVGVEPYSLGRHTYVGAFSHISQHTVIGNFCSIANSCTIGAQRHRLDAITSFPFEEIQAGLGNQATILGSDVYIGCNSVILSGLCVDHGAVIGAGAVVTKDVPPYAIVVGNPARILRYRFPEEIRQGLLETKWWDLPAEEIKRLPFTDPAACIAILRDRNRLLTSRARLG